MFKLYSLQNSLREVFTSTWILSGERKIQSFDFCVIFVLGFLLEVPSGMKQKCPETNRQHLHGA